MRGQRVRECIVRAMARVMRGQRVRVMARVRVMERVRLLHGGEAWARG